MHATVHLGFPPLGCFLSVVLAFGAWWSANWGGQRCGGGLSDVVAVRRMACCENGLCLG